MSLLRNESYRHVLPLFYLLLFIMATFIQMTSSIFLLIQSHHVKISHSVWHRLSENDSPISDKVRMGETSGKWGSGLHFCFGSYLHIFLKWSIQRERKDFLSCNKIPPASWSNSLGGINDIELLCMRQALTKIFLIDIIGQISVKFRNRFGIMQCYPNLLSKSTSQ